MQPAQATGTAAAAEKKAASYMAAPRFDGDADAGLARAYEDGPGADAMAM